MSKLVLCNKLAFLFPIIRLYCVESILYKTAAFTYAILFFISVIRLPSAAILIHTYVIACTSFPSIKVFLTVYLAGTYISAFLFKLRSFSSTSATTVDQNLQPQQTAFNVSQLTFNSSRLTLNSSRLTLNSSRLTPNSSQPTFSSRTNLSKPLFFFVADQCLPCIYADMAH